MTTTVQTQSDYRDLPLDWLVASPTNPRKTFDEDAMQELAASIRENGVLQPLLVRPRTERSFEIVFGERRYRGAAMAEKETVPVCIREMTDAQVLEAQLIELSIVGKSFSLYSCGPVRCLYVNDVPGRGLAHQVSGTSSGRVNLRQSPSSFVNAEAFYA